MGCVYRIYCHATGRSYIGQTAYSHPFQRFADHQRDAKRGKEGALYDALRMYDIHEFECSCLRVVPNEQLNALECYYAEIYDAYMWSGGYNDGECGQQKVAADMNDERRSWMRRNAIRRSFFRRT